jgi:hypothetical protein
VVAWQDQESNNIVIEFVEGSQTRRIRGKKDGRVVEDEKIGKTG